MEKFDALYPQKDCWCYTGYTLERDLFAGGRAHTEVTAALLSHIDVLVDGEFELAKKDLKLRFRGSSNQRIIDVKRTLREGRTILWRDGKY